VSNSNFSWSAHNGRLFLECKRRAPNRFRFDAQLFILIGTVAAVPATKAKEASATMSDIAQYKSSVKQSDDAVDDFVWGAREIGLVISRTEKQAAYLLETGTLKCARKKSGRWVAHRATLIREMIGE
jgi:hypothetical protein